ncbi:hypothetical protein J7T55_013075 [Diaporthe amygdali]|uniref:uncharacterized protein n=1 Tax=Phomopsis amygdali TaxID=1214568 RepID=UPI0022FE8072|nr:uncharacterized protein J7T55_013075 [Diaporthe amygdali]KAJ0118820.1 hypothetical protein J7T55_013075 [Diaporthe amygdali]
MPVLERKLNVLGDWVRQLTIGKEAASSIDGANARGRRLAIGTERVACKSFRITNLEHARSSLVRREQPSTPNSKSWLHAGDFLGPPRPLRIA